MKKKITSIILTLNFLMLPIFSLEWGGIIKNNTELTFPEKELTVKQSNDLYLWASSPLGKDSGFYFTGEGFYKFSYAESQPKAIINHIFDLDLLKINGDINLSGNTLSLSLGRFFTNDITGVILNQLIDGIQANFSFPLLNLSLTAGYTGLLNSHTTTMLDSYGETEVPLTNGYSLAYKYIPVSLTVVFPVIFGNQSFGLETLACIDVNNNDSSKYYGSLYFLGPIANTVFYKISTTIQTVNFENIMNYSALNIFFSPSDFLTLGLGAEYASGANSTFSNFTTITSKIAYNSIFYPELRGVLIPKISCSFSIEELYTEVYAKYIFDATDSISSKGLEIATIATYNIFYDLQLGIDFNAFFDIKTKTDNNICLSIKASLAF